MLTARRLAPADADSFRALRIEAFTLESGSFRHAPESIVRQTQAEIEARLSRDFVVGIFAEGTLVGIGGFERFIGEKLAHKGLVWGMYVRASHRGTGATDLIMGALVEHARTQVEMLLLTVVASNARAVRFYERWGFHTYGVEPSSVKQSEGLYLDEALMVLRLS